MKYLNKFLENVDKEIIEDIEEVFGREEIGINGYSSSYSGFEITTNKQLVHLLINDDTQCCENWGYFFSNDDHKSFIGSELKSISITDTALNTKNLDLENNSEDEGTSTMFVNIETSNGLLQFTAYNSHNGYYGHTALVRSSSLNVEENL